MTAKIAKDWFKAHPRNVVSFHWRWNELGQPARDRLSTPRLATVASNRILFACRITGQSELSLKGVTATLSADGELQLFNPERHFVTYKAAAQ